MGSMDGYAKGDMPFLNIIKLHNARYNESLHRQSMAIPMWRRLLAFCSLFPSWIGRKFRRPLEHWCALNPSYKFQPEEDEDPMLFCDSARLMLETFGMDRKWV